MVSTTHDEDRRRLRVTIGAKELEQWEGEGTPVSLIKHWIKLGRAREGLREHLDDTLAQASLAHLADLEQLRDGIASLQDKLNGMIELVARLGHCLTVATTPGQYELEVLEFKRVRAALSQEEVNKTTLARNRSNAFGRLVEELFPNLGDEIHRDNLGLKREPDDAEPS